VGTSKERQTSVQIANEMLKAGGISANNEGAMQYGFEPQPLTFMTQPENRAIFKNIKTLTIQLFGDVQICIFFGALTSQFCGIHLQHS
jgi:hypothetical protein